MSLPRTGTAAINGLKMCYVRRLWREIFEHAIFHGVPDENESAGPINRMVAAGRLACHEASAFRAASAAPGSGLST